MSSTYTVRYAPQALDDLRDLYSYVAFSLKEPATAQKLVNRIRKAARSLDALPRRHPVVDWEPWQSMGICKTSQNRPLRKISNFFAINLLTIWVNRDIIQTTNPPT